MKKINIFLFAVSLSVLFFSCEYDNYEEPNARLYGNIVYQGEPINVGNNQVTFQLWEPGWELDYPIDVTVAPDGSYSAVVFKGTYKLVIPSFQGPFRSTTDTIVVELNGEKELDIEVEPYYMINNENFSLSGGTISASFGLEKIITGEGERNIESIHLYVNKTHFVDLQNNIGRSELSGSEITDLSSVTISTPVPELIVDQDYLFVRVGVKIANVEDMLYSTVQQIDL